MHRIWALEPACGEGMAVAENSLARQDPWTKRNHSMKTVIPGYVYELASYKPNGISQILQFVHTAPRAAGDDVLEELDDGTTTEEVIMVLMDRLTFLNAKLPSAHNTRAISSLRRALDELHARAADRVRRQVERTRKR